MTKKVKRNFTQECLDVLNKHGHNMKSMAMINAIRAEAVKEGWCINKDGLCEDDHCRCKD